MKRALGLLLLAALFTAPLFAETASVADQLIAKERQTWELYGAKNVAALAEMTAEDFVDIYVTGEVVDKKRYLDDVGSVEVESYELIDFKVIALTPESAIVVYTARSRGTVGGQPIRSQVAVTSAWAKRGETWLNVFYRENLLELDGKRLLPEGTVSPATGKKPGVSP